MARALDTSYQITATHNCLVLHALHVSHLVHPCFSFMASSKDIWYEYVQPGASSDSAPQQSQNCSKPLRPTTEPNWSSGLSDARTNPIACIMRCAQERHSSIQKPVGHAISWRSIRAYCAHIRVGPYLAYLSTRPHCGVMSACSGVVLVYPKPCKAESTCND